MTPPTDDDDEPIVDWLERRKVYSVALAVQLRLRAIELIDAVCEGLRALHAQGKR